MIACYRYIERNPVRAGMVRCVDGYRWSSHEGNCGRTSNTLLSPHPEYLALAAEETSRHAAYQDLFAAGGDPAFLAAIRDATNGGFALVGEELKAKLPADVRGRLERKPPGPRPNPKTETKSLAAEMELELGLRPGTG